LGKIPIVKIDQDDIAHSISPVWHAKPLTAKTAISRLRIVFINAHARNFLVNRAVIEDTVIIFRPEADISTLRA